MKNGERRPQAAPLYVYLCYGPSPTAERELRYALETLRATTQADVVLYTDRPAAFADLGIGLVDAAPLLVDAGAYRHRMKPMVLADALRRFARPCVLLDLDSFVRPGFAARVDVALAQGAAMNFLVRENPYPDLPPFAADLPHLGRYVYGPQARMFNSGLVAVTPAHLPLVEDALALIDAIWGKPFHRHDIEQFALTETLRLGGVAISSIDDVFVHYCPRWARRYMRRRLRRRAPGQAIPYSRARVRLFKAYWTLRLAMRKARRLRGASWRKT